MKNICLTASALILLGATAQAQMVFDGGEISATTIIPTSDALSGATNYGIEGRAAVSFGDIGFQIDLGYETAQGGAIINAFYSWDAGLHSYYKFGDTFKLGVFYTHEALGDIGSSEFISIIAFGAEALIEVGKVDVELSISSADTTFGADSQFGGYIVTADGYYQISDALEINAGVWFYTNEGGSGDPITKTTVGATYTLANMPVSLGVAYSNVFEPSGGDQGGIILANVSYNFGAGSGGRQFSNRSFNYMELVFALSN